MDIDGRVIVVTGAGSGLGAATASVLAQAGARLLLADIDRERGEAVAAELGQGARFVRVDVSDEASARGAFEQARQHFGVVHGLVNCAGIAPAEKVLGREGPHGLASFARTLSVNLVGSFNMLRLAAEAMSGNEPDAGGERGVIVNTASVAAYDGQVGQVAYAASKAGIVGLTLPAARELSRYGIRVMTIAPGIMETPMLAGMPEEVQASLGRMVPFPQRLGRPAEFAALVRHIFENSYLNGEVIRLDGAIRMAPK